MDSVIEDNSMKTEKINNLKRLKYKLIKDIYSLVQMILKNRINEEIIDMIEVKNYFLIFF